jgi:hypothetical protein
MRSTATAVLCLLALFAAAPALAQDHGHDAETQATVPELSTFHQTIYKIWHTAWPKKDVTMLASLLPDVEKGVASVAAAELPGILRDKKGAWEKGVAALEASSAAYKSAVEEKDSVKLLAAAEDLHAKFEGLVRVIRPPMKEVDDFHTSLYMFYHYALPEKNLGKIRETVKEMQEKLTPLEKAAIPEKHKSKEGAYRKAVAELRISVEALAKAAAGTDMKKISAAGERAHSDYQTLEHLFE